jgi:predicted nucleic acid-binding protein
MSRAAGCDCVLVPQALSEFFYAVTRKSIMPRSIAADQVRDWLRLFPITAGANAEAIRSALDPAVSGRFQFYDALLLATARAAGCTAVISEDMSDGAELDGVRVVGAFSPEGGVSLTAEALLPAATPD